MMIFQAITLLAIIFADFSEAKTLCKDCKYCKFTRYHSFCNEPNSNCTISKAGLNYEEKAYIVELHNNFRSKVALGKESSGGGLPQAANMLEMEWDEELADIAQKHAEQCDMDGDCDDCRRVDRFKVGQNLRGMSTTIPMSVKENIAFFVHDWYVEKRNFKKSILSSYVPSEGYTEWRSFTQMIWAKSSKIGCGYVQYEYEKEGRVWVEGRKIYNDLLVCNYGPAGNNNGEPVYEEGETASACIEKSSIPGLCISETTNRQA